MTAVATSPDAKWDILRDPEARSLEVKLKLLPHISIRVGHTERFSVALLIGGRYDIPERELIPAELQGWFYEEVDGKYVPHKKNLDEFNVAIKGTERTFVLSNLSDLRDFIILRAWESKISSDPHRTKSNQRYFWYNEERSAKVETDLEFKKAAIVSEIAQLTTEETLTIAAYLGEKVRGLSTDILKKRLLDHLNRSSSVDEERNRVVYALNHKEEAKLLAMLNRGLELGVLTHDYNNNTILFENNTLVVKDPEAYLRWVKNPANAAVIDAIKNKIEARLA